MVPDQQELTIAIEGLIFRQSDNLMAGRFPAGVGVAGCVCLWFILSIRLWLVSISICLCIC